MSNNPLKTTLLITAALIALVADHAMGQAWNYDKNRIAVSFDGNSEADNEYKWPTGDPDDWGAAAASFAIVAKLGLQDQLVHVSYNNFIDAPAGPDEENQLKISCDGAAERWHFKKTKIFDVTKQLQDAKTDLANEMGKSTADDPLYFMHAGLSEFLFQVVEEVVKQGKVDALEHVYVLSHSAFNENEVRRSYHRTWNDIQKLCANRLQYRKIKDQNDKNEPNRMWHSKKDFSVWHWMRDHDDSNVRWMYSRLEAHSGGDADISDCGMFFYLLTGDEDGSPEKFRKFLDRGILVAK